MRNASNYENARVAADVSLLSGTSIVSSDLRWSKEIVS